MKGDRYGEGSEDTYDNMMNSGRTSMSGGGK